MLKHKGDQIIRRRNAQQLRRIQIGLLSVLVITALTLLTNATQKKPFDADVKLEKAIDDELKVITRISPNTYFESDEGPSGFEYALLARFAESINKKLIITTTDSNAELFAQLNNQEVQLASAGLSTNQTFNGQIIYSEPYIESQPLVVYRVGNQKPRKPNDLIGHEVVVAADTNHSASLEKIRDKHPELQWREINNVDYMDLLARIENNEIEYTLLDSTDFLLHQGFFPRVKKAFPLGDKVSIAWAFSNKIDNPELVESANQYINELTANGTLAKLEEQYYGQAVHISQVDANEFAKNISHKLPKYLKAIKDIAQQHNLDWELLAAVSYQESGWNPLAKSRTGVRGMMMLTLPTAKEVNVTNRLDAKQSLNGGAIYLNKLKNRLPSSVHEPDRTWLALAAYNVGMGHLEDARIITENKGGDPNSWYDVKQSLPLLTQRKWYSKTRYGYARGYEPVHYVQNIRHYQNVLSWDSVAKQRSSLQ
ncbi:MAG: membrane-bound lytic murein transglycosylase MltF [Pseudomonadales bacterium]|nr:membrane-bound lytic murein transglycosylase MltF [Pseudomonadales bacterium]